MRKEEVFPFLTTFFNLIRHFLMESFIQIGNYRLGTLWDDITTFWDEN